MTHEKFFRGWPKWGLNKSELWYSMSSLTGENWEKRNLYNVTALESDKAETRMFRKPLHNLYYVI